MSTGFNRVSILGNLGADPELRITQDGQAVLKMRLAASESWLDREGRRQERTEWFSVVCFAKRAEALGKILAKGARIFVEGSLRTSSYEKKGEKRYFTEVIAREIVLNGRAQGDTAAARDERGDTTRRNEEQEDETGAPNDYAGDDDEIPF